MNAIMLSPKMQRSIRINDSQILMLAEKARFEHVLAGYLHKKSSGATKWTRRYFILFQNLLFYFETENGVRPAGVILLEGCYCERLILKDKMSLLGQFSFAITYRRENLRQYELRADSESDCKTWIDAIRTASFNKLLLQKEELEQKYLHLLQIVESEKTAKWQYTVQCEQLASEIKKLRSELCALKKEWRLGSSCSTTTTGSQQLETDDLKKIKKVQSFFRGWLCRRRWKQIVEEYIKSPHAEAMRKRNSLVFRMVEAEEEYVEQLEVVVSGFLRPMRMAASSKNPPVTHEDVSSIFLNVETVLFLHQIFLKGLTARIEQWPTLVLGIGDLFDMLLPMLSIYQEYVRNHHYSLQVLTECKQQATFASLLGRLENKSACQGRSLESFLTYPMHQIPRYIITLHELLAHTPYDHVERKSLENARAQLEELSRQMHDEVSETENLRKNLAIERMIVEGCDILLDVNQVFVRQGNLIQVMDSLGKKGRARILKTEKEAVRQAFLFSNHLILTTRAANGRLHLAPGVGKIPLADCTLIEDPSESGEAEPTDDVSLSSQSSYSDSSNSQLIKKSVGVPDICHGGLDFKIILDTKNGPMTIHMVAPSAQEKHAWTSDISQCMDNVHFHDLLHGSDSASVAVPHSVRSDPKLFKDDVDIRFSRTLNSCKVPQIRYATPERLLERLTDLRFLSIDFLNTFLLTYRVFTDSVTVLEALKKVYYNQEPPDASNDNMDGLVVKEEIDYGIRLEPDAYRRISTTSTVSGYGTESDRDPEGKGPHWRWSYRKGMVRSVSYMIAVEESSGSAFLAPGPPSPPARKKSVTLRVEDVGGHLLVPPGGGHTSASSETLTDQRVSAACSGSVNKKRHSSLTSDPSEASESEEEEPVRKQLQEPTSSPAQVRKTSSTSIYAAILQRRASKQRPSYVESDITGASSTPRSSFQTHGSESPTMSSKAGVVVTSSRQSQRRSSSASAAAAFAIATAGSTCAARIAQGQTEIVVPENEELKFVRPRKESVLSSAATMRVLSVLRHWVAKHSQDFEDPKLRDLTVAFLEDILCSPALLPAENKAASQLLRLLTREEPKKVDLAQLLQPTHTKETIESLSALEIAEQMTYLDHEIFVSIRSEEFLGQAWTKDDREVKAPHISIMTRRFNEISRLVVSDIIRQTTQIARLQAMEKWAAVGDICRVLHNFNGVIQICAAFTNSAVYRLKKTNEKLSKTTRGTLERLHSLMGTDGRFRGLREALHRVDPPGIPYLGMYLSDLTFIEESTPNYTPEGLLNFAKMRMIAHVIREIRQFQQTPYKIEYGVKACSYLLDQSLLLDDEELYKLSLAIEPKQGRLTSQSSTS